MREKSNGSNSYNGHPSYNAREDYQRGGYRGSRGGRSEKLELANFNAMIGLVLFIGFLINYLMAKYLTQYFVNINEWVLLIGYFAIGFTGIAISNKSDNPWISFLGYLMVVAPVGVVLSICLKDQSSVSIQNAVLTTIGVTVIMVIASQIKPDIFLSIGRALFVALVAVIIIEIIMLLVGIARPTFWDYLVALLFCGYIGYDWAKAQRGPHTADEAVDACVDLYLDIINLFLRILSIQSRRDD